MSDAPPAMPLLDQAPTPDALRTLPEDVLPDLAAELRTALIETVSRTGGHLGAGLGVVELTLALHYVFDTPHDRLIWDVGHQAYPHKILTGRRHRMDTLRQAGGLSGFTNRAESPYDPFGTGHSSTSISAGLGMEVGARLTGESRRVLCVIGDGAMSAGQAYEALNNAGAMDSPLVVILNDNDMSIAPAVGAMSAYLSRLLSSKSYRSFRHLAKGMAQRFPGAVERTARRAEEFTRGLITGGTLFEEMGFYYVGPVDGHNFDHLLPVLRNIRDAGHRSPILVHVVTQKGRGYAPAEEAADKYHGVGCFDVVTGTLSKPRRNAPTYTSVFAEALVAAAERDDAVVAITAAMPAGTGLDRFAERFPSRCFDVGIAEQHAVTFAAGLACEGLKPFCALYSTFLQRAYDQVIHDVALQGLPVRFAIDRGGLVGADGATHQGVFDLAFLGPVPGLTVMAPADEAELMHAVATAVAADDGPFAFRYPRGEGWGVDLPTEGGRVLTPGQGRVVREGTQVALLALGPPLADCLAAAERLAAEGLSCTVADARWLRPLDTALVTRLAAHHSLLVTVEEGVAGGFGSVVLHHLARTGGLDRPLRVRPLTLPDHHIEHASAEAQRAEAGLDAAGIAAVVRREWGGG